MSQFLTIHNNWEYISYGWKGKSINPEDIKSILIKGHMEPMPIKTVKRTEHYNDMGRPCTATSNRLYMYVELLDEWYEVTDRVAKKVIALIPKE